MDRKVIQISFKDDEMELYYRIQTRCKLLSKSGWIKEALLEKLEREENPQPTIIEKGYLPINNTPIENTTPVKNLDSFLNFK